MTGAPRFTLPARAALAGAATGLRSTVVVAALVEQQAAGLPAALRSRRARLAAGLAVAGELAADKAPWTPSRLAPPGLGARVAFAALAGTVLARGADRPVAPAALVAGAAALAGARVGHDVRVAAAKRRPPLAVAAAEDAIALALAALATCGSRPVDGSDLS